MYLKDLQGNEFYLNDFVFATPRADGKTDILLHSGKTVYADTSYGEFAANWHRMKG